MALKDVEPGRYPARVVDWGIETVEQLGGEPKAKILFDFEFEGSWERITWDGFFTKRDGEINQKTLDTLKLCGLDGGFDQLLEGGSGLDTAKELEITIVEDGQYMRVEWVNEPGGSAFIKKEQGDDISKKLKGLSIDAGLGKSKSKKKAKPKNHAPGADRGVDEDEELPF